MHADRMPHTPHPSAPRPFRPARVAVAAVALVALAGCAMPRELSRREESRNSVLALAPQSSITVETHGAEVKFVASADDSVRIVTWKKVVGYNRRHVDTIWSQMRVTMERTGNELVLRTYEPERKIESVTVNFGPYHYGRTVEFKLTIAVPRGHAVTLRGDRGDVTAYGLDSDLSLDLHAGDVQIDEHTGRLEIETTAGDVRLARVDGPLRVRTHSGDVTADSLLAGADIHSASGGVSVMRSHGTFALETSSGDVKFKTSAGNATVRTGAGDIELLAQLDSLVAESTSGDQDLELASAPRHVSAQSSSGDVVLRVPGGSGGQLEIGTSSGTISVKSPVKVAGMSRVELTGDLGGAGSTWVHTSSGDITVETLHARTADNVGGDDQ